MRRRFSADWLMLREPADAAARDQVLMRRFAAALPPCPRILDLGAGTGAMARAVAPIIGGAQHWLLAETDPAHLQAQDAAMQAFVSCSGRKATRWSFSPLACDLGAAWDAAADGVTASAFFDLASAALIERFARWLVLRRLPLLAALTVDGRRKYFPGDPDDELVADAFRRHQRRDKGFGPALGMEARAALARALLLQDYTLVEAASDWRLGAPHGDLLRALVAGEAAAAREAGAIADGWERRRRAAIKAGALAASIGHRDLLALPRQICENTVSSGGAPCHARSGTAR